MINFEKIIEAAIFLPGDDYDKYWDKFAKDGIKAKKLEFLQSYDFIDGNEDFKNKNYDKFLEMLVYFYNNAYGGKSNIKRIHYIEYPLNEYIKMEYYTYLIDEKFGQDIRITTDRTLFPNKSFDFVLFENGNLFILNFGNNDTWLGAWHVTDKKIIDGVSKWFDEIFEKCVNFKTIMEPDDYIINKLKNNVF